MSLPSALEALGRIAREAQAGTLVVALDYDGTLTPIVSRPEAAVLSDEVRATLAALAAKVSVIVMSGRGLDDVRARVGIEGPIYGGSHGFEIAGPGWRFDHPVREAVAPRLASARASLEVALAAAPGVAYDPKPFSLAVHYRHAPVESHEAVVAAVTSVAQRLGMRFKHGKMVIELVPDVDWHKGAALEWVLARLAIPAPFVVYAGDDVTDEDAFRAVLPRGVAVLIAREPRPTVASHRLDDPAALHHFLARIVAAAP